MTRLTEPFIDNGLKSRIFSWTIFLLPALVLTTPFGIGLLTAIILMGLIYCAKPLWLRRKELFGPARWIIIAFAFNLLLAVCVLLSDISNLSIIDKPLAQMLALPAIGLIILTRPKAHWFWYGLFFGTVGAAAIAIYQRFGLNMPRAGGFHQIIMFGDISMAMAIISLASVNQFAKTRLAIFPYVAFLAGLIASILSVSRGGWIALGLAFLPMYFFGRRKNGRTIMLAGLLGACVVIAASFVPQLGVGLRLAAIAEDLRQYRAGNPFTDIGVRLEIWKGAWTMFWEHPLLGVGRPNFGEGIRELIARGEIHPSMHVFRHAHNEMLQALSTGGLVGAASLILLYGAPILFFKRSLLRGDEAQPFALAGLLLVLSFIFFGLTQVLFSHHVGAAFYALTVSVLVGICASIEQRKIGELL